MIPKFLLDRISNDPRTGSDPKLDRNSNDPRREIISNHIGRQMNSDRLTINIEYIELNGLKFGQRIFKIFIHFIFFF